MASPSDQVRMGIIGMGQRGALALHWRQPEGRSIVVAGADVNPQAQESIKKHFGESVFVTDDYRRILERNDVDAVAILSPDFCHEEQAIAALEAGKHVYSEKPMAITTDGCDRILEAWRKSGRHYMIGHNMRYMRVFQVMKKIVDSGTIGEIKAVWVRHFVGTGGGWYYSDWHGTRRNATSLLLQKACHDIDMIHWITGQYTKRTAAFGGLDFYGGDKPNDLTCSKCPDKDTCTEYYPVPGHEQCQFRREIDVEDNSVVIMELGNGIKASYTQCHFTPEYNRNYTFIGTEGRIENMNEGGDVICRMRGQSKKWKNLADRTYHVKPSTGGHGGADPQITQDFINLILTGKLPESSPLAGRMTVAVGCAAAESMRSGGRSLDIPAPPAWLLE